jgi:hypothetical protein
MRSPRGGRPSPSRPDTSACGACAALSQSRAPRAAEASTARQSPKRTTHACVSQHVGLLVIIVPQSIQVALPGGGQSRESTVTQNLLSRTPGRGGLRRYGAGAWCGGSVFEQVCTGRIIRALTAQGIASWQPCASGLFPGFQARDLHSLGPLFRPWVCRAGKPRRYHNATSRPLDDAFPYAEDYWNALQDPTSPTSKFHRQHYGDMRYQGFRDIFIKGLAQWSPRDWAREFKAAGAGYVVLTAKYADGYFLWPSRIPHPREPNWTSQGDVVGELAAACRTQGLRFGVYYSGGLDW